jgi:phytoene dehydrogenase-like protein
MESLGPAPTAVSLYLSLRESPATLGCRGENYWISEDYEHDAERENDDALRGRPSGCYLSFPSLKDPEAKGHTAEILVLPDYDAFKRWADRPWKQRGEEYEAIKARLAAGMLELVERHLPGFRDLVDYSELSTPLSVEHFTASPRGAIYGLPATPERFRQDWLGVRTPVKNVFLAGADVYVHGVLGAAMGGVAAAGAVLGPLGFPRLMGAIKSSSDRWSS